MEEGSSSSGRFSEVVHEISAAVLTNEAAHCGVEEEADQKEVVVFGGGESSVETRLPDGA